ncbi:MAG TPA: protease modulator HflC [Pseudomonadales bacterium]|nr:protease modulator HflC [Pseudomonadales bacterium]
MMNRLGNILLSILAALWLASQFVFVVYEFEKVVMLRFGKLVQADIAPGLHIRIPFMDQVRHFDGRILTLDTQAERYPTVEKKSVMVDLYAHWRIVDVARYYTATGGDETRAELLISQRINSGLRDQFGVRTLQEVVSGERDKLMVDMRDKLTASTREELGIEMVDVRVKRIDLPDEVSSNVYDRMNSERAQEARKHRSEGIEIAEGIRADADRQKIVLEAEAYRDAEKLRGQGDAESTAIYAAAFSKDTEFYNFTRSLQAYRGSFDGRGDLLVLNPDNAFFHYLKNPDAKNH